MNSKQRRQAAKLGERVLQAKIIPLFEELLAALESRESSVTECIEAVKGMIAEMKEPTHER